MKPLKTQTPVIIICLALILLPPCIIFLCRSPVIIAADEASVLLYGEARLRKEERAAAFALYRPVKTVVAADDADENIIPYAIADASLNPHCVLFPLRFARSAQKYRELNPDVPVVILEGRYSEDASPALTVLGGSNAGLFIYKTDIDADFYQAGLAAYVLDRDSDIENGGRILVFIDSSYQRQGREAFLMAVNSQENPPETLFLTSFYQYSEIPGLSCVVLAGSGIEFLENEQDVPILLFTWLDPYLAPDEAVLVFNDSPWAQAVQAVKMAENEISGGLIQSKIIYKNTQKISRKALRKVQN